MKREEVFALTKECYSSQPASCTYACPFRLDLRAFLKKAAKGKLSSAAKELKAVLPFPKTINALCPRPCESACQCMTVVGGESIAIGLIEKQCLNAPEKKERKAYVLPKLPQRAAVVGAGPAGLACALYLSRKRYSVTVFEQSDSWGGSLKQREDFALFDAEFKQTFDENEVEFVFGTKIEDISCLEGFDASFISTGKDGEDFGLLESLDISLGSTAKGGVFLGGGLAGLDAIGGMAHAQTVSKAMESYIQSGSPDSARDDWDDSFKNRYAPHPNEQPTKRVTPSNGEVYTDEEAAAEAARCMQCDCTHCMQACELLEKYKKKPPRIAVDVAQDGQTRNSVSSACITRQTWSCSQCGRCSSMCAVGADVKALFELSRLDRVASGSYPPAFHAYRLREMDWATGEAAFFGVPEGEGCNYAFFPGCRLGAVKPDYVFKAVQSLEARLGSVAVMLSCCGIPALWAGEGDKFKAHIEALERAWQSLGRPKVVYSCASCRRTFERFLPHIELVSLYELLNAEKRNSGADKAAIFDPCAAAGMEDIKRAVRKLAADSGANITDYDSAGKCCGFGGHMELANPELYLQIKENRCAETEDPFLVYCVNCLEVFKSEGKACRHVLDLVFSLEDSPIPTLEEKKNNLFKVKETLMKKFGVPQSERKTEEWENISLTIDPQALEKMERALIPEGDVKKAVWQNEEERAGFVNETGEITCRLDGEYLTCWVRYVPTDSGYEVRDVYAHRMTIREA